METVSYEVDGKTITIKNVNTDLVAKVKQLFQAKIEREVPVSKIIDDFTKFNWVVVVKDAKGNTETFSPPVKEVKESVFTSSVKPLKLEPEPKKVKPPAIRGKGRPRVQPKVRQPSGTNPLEKRPGKKGHPPNQQRQQLAFELIELLVADGMPRKKIIESGWKRLSKTDKDHDWKYNNFYYYYKLWLKTQKKMPVKVNGIL